MKKFILFVLFLFLSANLNVFAFDGMNLYVQKAQIQNKFNGEKIEIRKVLSNLNSYSNKHQVDKVKSFYSKDFVSFDGFNRKDYFAMIDSTFKTYPDIKFASKIKTINVYGDWASVELTDYSTASVSMLAQNIENNMNTIDKPLKGVMKGTCNYVLYLKKTDLSWEIYTDNIIAEETSIRYGYADKINMELLSPLVAKENEPYCIKLDIRIPKKSKIGGYLERHNLVSRKAYFVLSSLSKENVVYPPSKPNEVFRQVTSKGVLERMVNANGIGVNEYSIASVGVARVSAKSSYEGSSADIKMAGAALLMKRVNVSTKKNVSKEDITTNEEPKAAL